MINHIPCFFQRMHALILTFISSIILVEPILEKFKFDFNSDQPLDEQELEGCKRLRKYCLESIEAAKEERQARVEEAYQAQLQEEEELRIQVRNLQCHLSSPIPSLM